MRPTCGLAAAYRDGFPAGMCLTWKDERADVTTDGQVSLSNGTVHVSGPG
jgi:hypothetical protein